MKPREVKDIHVSVKQKLYASAKKRNEDFNAILRRYFQERFLYRVSVSRYAANFILKGAQLIIAHHADAGRTTKDIDFLGINFPSDRSRLTTALKEIAEIEYRDGAAYLLDEERTEDILEKTTYKGLRFYLNCRLGSVKSNIQIDIGFGDKIFPHPELMNYPVILPFECPRLFVYTLESAIAEKFETITALGLVTSRIKDYFDLYYLATNKSFNKQVLREAVLQTFHERGTSLGGAEYILEPGFALSQPLQKMWEIYLKKRPSIKSISFVDAHHVINLFLSPIIENVRNLEDYQWIPSSLSWRRLESNGKMKTD
ncbi:MAG: nucleotidyl transferase AbiEii/AbiGii toxin family protein [Ignavibacteriaceae bacterium]|nr:nucleotidyl transferase AbiEii/AbiGii toxin family protein [Ignavibacteriaceae bacterium]